MTAWQCRSSASQLTDDRVCDARYTLSRIRPHFRELGITRLGELTGLDSLGLPVAFATRPNSLSLSVSLGKGVDIDCALISAAMEAAETAVAEVPIDGLLALSLAEARKAGMDPIDLDRVARCHPHRIDPHDKIHWLEAQNLLSDKKYLVPWALIGLDHTLAPAAYHDAFYVASDGLASGNTKAEATFHGLCELVERDALAGWQFAGEEEIARSEIRITGAEDAAMPAVLDALESARTRLRVFEMRTDIGVPCFMAILEARHLRHLSDGASRCGGCGCHPQPGRAIVKAITEAAQARLALVAGARDDIHHSDYELRNTMSQLPPRRKKRPAAAASVPAAAHHADGRDIETANSRLISQIRRAGVDQLFAIELPAAKYGINVVRVVGTELQVPLQGERVQVTPRGLRNLRAAA